MESTEQKVSVPGPKDNFEFKIDNNDDLKDEESNEEDEVPALSSASDETPMNKPTQQNKPFAQDRTPINPLDMKSVEIPQLFDHPDQEAGLLSSVRNKAQVPIGDQSLDQQKSSFVDSDQQGQNSDQNLQNKSDQYLSQSQVDYQKMTIKELKSKPESPRYQALNSLGDSLHYSRKEKDDQEFIFGASFNKEIHEHPPTQHELSSLEKDNTLQNPSPKPNPSKIAEEKPADTQQHNQFLKKYLSSMPTIPNPIKQAGFFGETFFLWTNKLVDTAYKKKTLDPSDLYLVNPLIKSAQIKENFLIFQEKNKEKLKGNSTVDNIIKFLSFKYRLAFVLFVFQDLAQFASPLVLKEYVILIQTKQLLEKWEYTIGLMIILGAVLFLRSIIRNHAFFYFNQCGNMTSIISRALIVDKLLEMDIVYNSMYSTPRIVNLMTEDVTGVINGFQILPRFVASTCLILAAMYSLSDLNWLTFIVPVVLLIVLLIQRAISRKLVKLRREIYFENDERAKTLGEMVDNIMSVKLACYQDKFISKIAYDRKQENRAMYSFLKLGQWSELLVYLTPQILAFLLFSLTEGLGINAIKGQAETFQLISILSLLRTPIQHLNDAFNRIPMFYVGKERIMTFLDKTQKRKKSVDIQDPSLEKGEIQIIDCDLGLNLSNFKSLDLKRKIQHRASFNQVNQQAPTISDSNITQEVTCFIYNLTMAISPKEKICLVGNQSSGKTTFLLSILNETSIAKGELKLNGCVGYLNNKEYLIQANIRDNILFSNAYDAEKYHKIIQICEIQSEIESLYDKDDTIIKGMNENIGHSLAKKIQLARILYEDKDIYLFDEYFDGIGDQATSKRIFRNVVLDYLRDKTVIYVTGDIKFAKESDRIMVLSYGLLEELGSFKKLSKKKNGVFYNLFCREQLNIVEEFDQYKEHQKHRQRQNQKRPSVTKLEDLMEKKQVREANFKARRESMIQRRNSRQIIIEKIAPQVACSYLVEQKKDKVAFFKVMRQYFFSKDALLGSFILLLYSLTQCSSLVQSWFLSAWSAKLYGTNQKFYMSTYAGLVAFTIIVVLMRGFGFAYYSIRISSNLYFRAVKAILSARMSWHSQTPTGRIINRCTAEQAEVDQLFPVALNLALQWFYLLLGSLVLIMCFTNYVVVIYLIQVVMLGYTLYKFLSTTRSLKQISLLNRSKLISELVEIKKGLLHIRTNHKEEIFRQQFYTIADCYQNSRVAENNICGRWISIRVELIAMFFPILAMLNTFIAVMVEGKAPLLAGLKNTIAQNIVFFIGNFLIALTQSDSFLVVIDRINEFVENKDVEKINEGNEPPNWPSKGQVTIKNFTFKKANKSQHNLFNINLIIQPGEKLALVGNAGQGKHSLVHYLIGLLDPKTVQKGYMEIDGYKVAELNSIYLREKIVFMEQSPILFTGTLLENIDPKGVFDIETIIKCFEYLDFWRLLDSHDQEKHWVENNWKIGREFQFSQEDNEDGQKIQSEISQSEDSNEEVAAYKRRLSNELEESMNLSHSVKSKVPTMNSSKIIQINSNAGDLMLGSLKTKQLLRIGETDLLNETEQQQNIGQTQVIQQRVLTRRLSGYKVNGSILSESQKKAQEQPKSPLKAGIKLGLQEIINEENSVDQSSHESSVGQEGQNKEYQLRLQRIQQNYENFYKGRPKSLLENGELIQSSKSLSKNNNKPKPKPVQKKVQNLKKFQQKNNFMVKVETFKGKQKNVFGQQSLANKQILKKRQLYNKFNGPYPNQPPWKRQQAQKQLKPFQLNEKKPSSKSDSNDLGEFGKNLTIAQILKVNKVNDQQEYNMGDDGYLQELKINQVNVKQIKGDLDDSSNSFDVFEAPNLGDLAIGQDQNMEGYKNYKMKRKQLLNVLQQDEIDQQEVQSARSPTTKKQIIDKRSHGNLQQIIQQSNQQEDVTIETSATLGQKGKIKMNKSSIKANQMFEDQLSKIDEEGTPSKLNFSTKTTPQGTRKNSGDKKFQFNAEVQIKKTLEEVKEDNIEYLEQFSQLSNQLKEEKTPVIERLEIKVPQKKPSNKTDNNSSITPTPSDNAILDQIQVLASKLKNPTLLNKRPPFTGEQGRRPISFSNLQQSSSNVSQKIIDKQVMKQQLQYSKEQTKQVRRSVSNAALSVLSDKSNNNRNNAQLSNQKRQLTRQPSNQHFPDNLSEDSQSFTCQHIYKKSFNKQFTDNHIKESNQEPAMKTTGVSHIAAFDASKVIIPPKRMEYLKERLNREVNEGGENFTITQRKLIMLGKALLKKPKLLLIDSLSLSMNDVFSNVLYEVVMQNFTESTIITILAKLEYLHYFKKVAVVHSGRVMEVGKIANIIIRNNSYLVDLIKSKGDPDLLSYIEYMIKTHPK